MARTEIKQEVQTRILIAAQAAFDKLADDYEGGHQTEYEEFRLIMSEQFARIEKMFGFDPYSFTRGC